LTWEELTPEVRPAWFSISNLQDRVSTFGDLYEPVLAEQRSLAAAARQLERITRRGE
jgi:DNA primase